MPDHSFLLSRIFEFAHAESHALHSSILGTPQLFIALTKLGGVTASALEAQGKNPKEVRDALRAAVGRGKAPEGATPQLTDRATANIEKAEALAKAENTEVAERHVLAAVLHDDEGITLRVLKTLGVDLNALRQAAGSTSATPTLDQLGRNLTELASKSKLSPMIGRKEELRRLVRTLARKSKNNPVLIGQAGVGKTAIVEGLAQLIAVGTLPELAGARLVEISTASLVADTTYRGQFEKRLLALLDEIRRAGNVILFIDEIHTILRAGAVEGGALDAGNILKPALARSEFRLIGATTTEEYEKFIASDAALERRFQPIMVNEPTIEETIAILVGAKHGYETHHNVLIANEAIEATVKLSTKWITERRLPDKAFDLLDEACARARLPTISSPAEVHGGTMVTKHIVALVLSDWINIAVEAIESL